jgi:hypothetical protein
VNGRNARPTYGSGYCRAVERLVSIAGHNPERTAVGAHVLKKLPNGGYDAVVNIGNRFRE